MTQNIVTDTDQFGDTQVVYTLGPALYGNLVSQRRGSTTSWYHFDGLGSTDRLTNSTGTVTDNYVYRAFGSEQFSSGGTTNSFEYVGEQGYYADPDLAESYVRARYDDPSTGRWISPDPIGFGGADTNLYRYLNNAPTIAIDPSGLQELQFQQTPVFKFDGGTTFGKYAVRTGALDLYYGTTTMWNLVGDDAAVKISVMLPESELIKQNKGVPGVLRLAVADGIAMYLVAHFKDEATADKYYWSQTVEIDSPNPALAKAKRLDGGNKKYPTETIKLDKAYARMMQDLPAGYRYVGGPEKNLAEIRDVLGFGNKLQVIPWTEAYPETSKQQYLDPRNSAWDKAGAAKDQMTWTFKTSLVGPGEVRKGSYEWGFTLKYVLGERVKYAPVLDPALNLPASPAISQSDARPELEYWIPQVAIMPPKWTGVAP